MEKVPSLRVDTVRLFVWTDESLSDTVPWIGPSLRATPVTAEPGTAAGPQAASTTPSAAAPSHVTDGVLLRLHRHATSTNLQVGVP